MTYLDSVSTSETYEELRHCIRMLDYLIGEIQTVSSSTAACLRAARRDLEELVGTPAGSLARH